MPSSIGNWWEVGELKGAMVSERDTKIYAKSTSSKLKDTHMVCEKVVECMVKVHHGSQTKFQQVKKFNHYFTGYKIQKLKMY